MAEISHVELFSDHHIHTHFFNISNKLRKSRVLTDVVLNAGGRSFHAHRFVLVVASDYFMTMFHGPLATKATTVQIHGIASDVMESILDYLYTGDILISEDNIQDLIEASSLMLLASLKDRCDRFIRARLHASNCLQVYSIGKQFSLRKVQSKAMSIISVSFIELCCSSDFNYLSFDVIVDILSVEDISVASEDDVFNAVLCWFRFDPLSRRHDFAKILRVVHLPYVSTSLLKSALVELQTIDDTHSVVSLINECMGHPPGGDVRCYEAWAKPRKCVQFSSCIMAEGGTHLHLYNLEKNEWYEVVRCKTRHCPGMDVIGTRIYIVGGSLGWKRKSCGECYDADTDKWSSISDMHERRSNFGLVNMKGKLYAVGGYDGNTPLRTAEVYNRETDRWKVIEGMFCARDGVSALTDGDFLYAIGGYDGNRYLNSVEYYDPESGAWENQSVPDMRVKRQNAMSAYSDACVFVIGGYYGDQFHTSVEMLHLKTLSWRDLASLPHPRHYAGATIMNGSIFVCGGWSEQLPVSSVLVYSIDLDEWRSVADLPTPTMIRSAPINFPRKRLITFSSRYDQEESNKDNTSSFDSLDSGHSL